MKKMRALQIYCLILILIQGTVGGSRTPLYVGALFEFSEHWFKDYTSFFPKIIDRALEDVRNQSDVLQDYDLTVIYRDTKGQNGYAASQMIEMLLDKERPIVAVLGPSLSRELIVTGQIAPFYNVIELSCIATTASTADEDLYPTVFTVNQVPHTLDKLRIEMTRYFGWKRIGTLAFQIDYSTSQIDSFHQRLQEQPNQDIELVATAIIANNSNIKFALQRFKENNVRIIHAVFSSTYAPYVFCEAYKQGLYGDSYVWILSGQNMYKDWTTKASLTDCTEEELVKASDGYFTLNYHILSQSLEPTINGQIAQDILNELEEQAEKENVRLVSYASWIYDMVWTLSLGLNNSLKYLDATGLKGFNNSEDFLNAIVTGTKEVDFIGMSGRVYFAGTRFRKGNSFVQRNKDGGNTGNIVATNELNKEANGNESHSFTLIQDPWPDGWPTDRFMNKYILVSTSSVAFGLVITAVFGGLFLALCFASCNIYYRKQKDFKMSSPFMNNIIILGCILLYLDVLLISLSYHRVIKTETCMIRTWLMSLGFTTLFGALFSKTYRVYVIFRHGSYKSKVIKDYHLIAKVGALLAIDSIILVPWTIFHPQHVTAFSKLDKKMVNKNTLQYTVYLHCAGDYEVYWFGALYIFKGLLLVLGTFLAWETRTVRVTELNDSKYIGACIYNVAILCVFGVPIAHVLSIEQTTLAFVLNAWLILFCTTISLCIIFVPKIRNRNQVHGKFILPQLNTSSNATSGKPCTSMEVKELNAESNLNMEKNMADLIQENKDLRMKIATETIAMAKLKKTILEQTGNLHIYRSGDEYIAFRNTTESPADQPDVDFV